MAAEHDPRQEADAHLNPNAFSADSETPQSPHTPSDQHTASKETADYDQLHSSGDGARDQPADDVSGIHATDAGSGGQLGAGLPAGEAAAGHVGRKEGQEKPKGVTEKVKEAVYQMKDTLIGYTQHHEARSATAPGVAAGTAVHDESGATDLVEKVGCLDKVKDMITGQKAGQGSATGNATTDDARTHAAVRNAAESKDPNVADVTENVGQPSGAAGIHGAAARPEGMLDRIKDKLGLHEHDKQGDVNSIDPTHSANRDDVHGSSADTTTSDGFPRPVHPSEAYAHDRHRGSMWSKDRTQATVEPKEAAGTDNGTEKEGLMSKMMSKLHLGSSEKSPTPN